MPRLALDLLGLGEQIDEHGDLGPQHDRVDRLEHIVDRAHRVAAQQMLGFLVHRRQEDDRDALGLVAAADDLGGLVAVHAGHVDVEQDDRELALEQVPQRLLAGPREHDVAEILEDALRRRAGCARRRRPAGRAAARGSLGPRPDSGSSAACTGNVPHGSFTPYSAASIGIGARRSRLFARSRDPHPQQREQQLDIDRLGDIVGRAGIEALLPVALHRLGGHRDQRQIGKLRPLADLLHGLVAVHFRHHDVDQRDIDARRLLEDEDAVLSPLGVEHLHIVALQNARQREDVADVVIDDEHLGAGELRNRRRRGARRLRPCAPRLAATRPAREASANTPTRSSRSAGFSVTPNAPIPMTDCLRSAPEMTWIGIWLVSRIVLEQVEQHEAVDVGEAEVERDRASAGACAPSPACRRRRSRRRP